MKLDIVQAWKDQIYRQSLDNEQIAILPSHPAGDLVEADLAAVCGGVDGGPFGIFGTSASSATAIHREVHVHTFATVCDANTFSTTQTQAAGVLHFLFGALQSCTNNS